MRFLIFFKADGQFKSYNCFICGERGGNLGGLNKLVKQIEAPLSFIDIITMAGDGSSYGDSGLSQMDQSLGRLGEVDEAAPIDYPPPWFRDTDEVFKKGIEYLESRGVDDPAGTCDKYGLVFSEDVEIFLNGEPFVKPWPCLVAPMAGAEGEVFGWTTRYLGTPPNGDTKAIAMKGSGWRNKTLFGIREIDPKRPVSIVEGVFSALSTPNAVALGGKEIGSEQVDLLAATGARVFVFALDPFVDVRKFSNAMYRLGTRLPGCAVLHVDWEQFGGDVSRDPNDRGMEEMKKIIARTVMAKIV
jgi:hypothetical protein